MLAGESLSNAYFRPDPTGSGYAGEAGERTIQLLGETLNASKKPFRMLIKVHVNNQDIFITQAEKDGKRYATFEYQGETIKSLYMDGFYYQILDNEKYAIKMSISQIAVELFENSYDPKKAQFTAGTEEIGGVPYEYDEMTNADGTSTRIYYEWGTSTFKFLKNSDGSFIEIIEYDNNPPNEWFEVPEGYTVVSM